MAVEIVGNVFHHQARYTFVFSPTLSAFRQKLLIVEFSLLLLTSQDLGEQI